MAKDLKSFANEYRSHLAQRDAQGIPPLPLLSNQALIHLQLFLTADSGPSTRGRRWLRSRRAYGGKGNT